MKGVFNIMKTNKVTKLLTALLATLTFFCLTATAFAGTGKQGGKSQTQAETSRQSAPAPDKRRQKDGKIRQERPMMYDNDRFEDWFEDRIDSRKHDVDFSQLPENPTDEELLDFFKQNFLGDAPEKKSDAKPERPVKKDRKAERFEDWFEDRIDEHEHCVDFSQLGENPTDEEIVEFFRNNFMGNTSSRKTDESDKPCSEQKAVPSQSGKKDAEPVPESLEGAPESIEPASAEQPTEEVTEQSPVEEPTEEDVKDKA